MFWYSTLMAERGRRAGTYGREAADPLLDELAASAAELAKRWSIALIASADPERIAALDLGLIAREGPALIADILTAADQDREPSPGAGSAAGIAVLARAEGGAELARAVELLRTVLWEAAVESAPRARSEPRAARRLLDVGERLAAACAALLAAELERLGRGGAAPPQEPDVQAPPRVRPHPPERIAIVDERGAEGEPPRRPAPPPAAEPPPIAVRDARAQQGPAAWIGAVGAQLQRFERDRQPFAVLLVELLEPARADAGSPLERAVHERRWEWGPLSLTRERPGRWWLVAPGADRAGAASLRERLEQALGATAPGIGSAAALGAVAIGIAVCPDDATDAPGLAAQADLDIYAARSLGRGEDRSGG